MNFGQREVIELDLYDDNGKFITKLDYLNDSKFIHQTRELIIESDIISTDLLNFIFDKEEDSCSDYDSALNKRDEYHSFIVQDNKFKGCKLIAKTFVMDEYSAQYKTLIYEIPKASVKRNFDMTSSNTQVSKYQINFMVKPFNEKGHLFKIHIEK